VHLWHSSLVPAGNSIYSSESMTPALVLYSAGIVDLVILAKRWWPNYVFLLASKNNYEQQYMWWCSCNNTWLAMTIPWWRPAATSLPPSAGCICCWLLAASSSSPSVCAVFSNFLQHVMDDEINHDELKFNDSTSVQLLSCTSVLASSSSSS
jgi:hypothetical protein